LLGLIGSEGGVLIVSANDGLATYSWLRRRRDTGSLAKEVEDVV